MDVILHLGAHRTASTTFQHYMRENAAALRPAGIGFWGPWRTRNGLLTGVNPVSGPMPAGAQMLRARGRIALNLARARKHGIRALVISDENMIGAPRHNLRAKRLYAGIGERMARFDHAFGGQITRIVLSVRSFDSYWSSVAAFAVARGHHVPDEAEFDRLVTANRHWREVIADLACAVPGAELMILPYEGFGGRPEAVLTRMTGVKTPPRRFSREWVNRAPGCAQLRQILSDRRDDPDQIGGRNGRWQPLNRDQVAALRDAYADDLFWLRAGADGLARFVDECGPAVGCSDSDWAQADADRARAG